MHRWNVERLAGFQVVLHACQGEAHWIDISQRLKLRCTNSGTSGKSSHPDGFSTIGLFTLDVPMSLALWSHRWHSGKLPTWKEEEKEGEILFSGMISTVLKTLEPRMPPALQNSHTLSYGTCASLCKERVDSYNSNPESKYFATQWITYSLESLKDRGI